jgi:glycosyltransferase involved in cell wall biosynthesis
MHGGSVTLARRYLEESIKADLILATDMLDLTTFLSLTRSSTFQTPAVLYMHENQLTYPLPEDATTGPMRRQKGERDLHYAFVNYSSMLAADRIVFNSEYHSTDMLAALPGFLKHFPEDRELSSVESLIRKSRVLPVGIERSKLVSCGSPVKEMSAEPLIIWNQRWEYDKNPGEFFQLLFEVEEMGLPFRLALCGEIFQHRPKEILESIERLGDKVIHVGYAPEDRYHQLLRESEITISTARHEFFGISIIEATSCCAFPILPRALSYPDIIPEQFHEVCLCEGHEEMLTKLCWALTSRQEAQQAAASLSARLVHFDWPVVARRYDDWFERVARDSRNDAWD